MKKINLKLLRREDGISLVEVVASVVLLTIIIMSVYYMFVQSAKTTKTSEDIIDATYIAQTIMEEFYSYSKNRKISQDLSTHNFNLTSHTFSPIPSENAGEYFFEEQTDVYIHLTISHKTIGSPAIGFIDLTRIIIKVYDEKNGILKAQMENTLQWGNKNE